MTLPIPFLMALHKIERAKLTARDIILLTAIQGTPGIMGRELALKIGLPSRSGVQYSIPRLVRMGLIEDRRVPRAMVQNPNRLHILPAGVAFLDTLLPPVDEATKP